MINFVTTWSCQFDMFVEEHFVLLNLQRFTAKEFCSNKALWYEKNKTNRNKTFPFPGKQYTRQQRIHRKNFPGGKERIVLIFKKKKNQLIVIVLYRLAWHQGSWIVNKNWQEKQTCWVKFEGWNICNYAPFYSPVSWSH